MELNKSGDLRGMHGKHSKGKAHYRSKGWILCQHDQELGYYPTLTELATEIGKNGHYMWQLWKGRFADGEGNIRKTTPEGYHIKPANVIEHRG